MQFCALLCVNSHNLPISLYQICFFNLNTRVYAPTFPAFPLTFRNAHVPPWQEYSCKTWRVLYHHGGIAPYPAIISHYTLICWAMLYFLRTFKMAGHYPPLPPVCTENCLCYPDINITARQTLSILVHVRKKESIKGLPLICPASRNMRNSIIMQILGLIKENKGPYPARILDTI